MFRCPIPVSQNILKSLDAVTRTSTGVVSQRKVETSPARAMVWVQLAALDESKPRK